MRGAEKAETKRTKERKEGSASSSTVHHVYCSSLQYRVYENTRIVCCVCRIEKAAGAAAVRNLGSRDLIPCHWLDAGCWMQRCWMQRYCMMYSTVSVYWDLTIDRSRKDTVPVRSTTADSSESSPGIVCLGES